MSKQIKVSDALYDRLKGAAEARYRSMGGEIEYMMDFMGNRNGAREEVKGQGAWIPDNHPANREPKLTDTAATDTSATTRGVKEVLADITLAQSERDSGLEFNQDPESRRLIEEKSNALIQQLWDEYNKLKATN